MNIKESKRLMNLAMKARVPYLLVGHSGIGKTQITEQEAKSIFPDHKFVTVMASQADVGDFIGIPDITTIVDANGKTHRVTSWARPDWMPYEPCVIFLDELNNARPDVESAMLQLVLEKRIHTHTLHADSYICAAINPATAEYTTANTMSAALVKRFVVIPFEPLSSEFLEYSEQNNKLHPRILSFLKHRPDITGAEKPLKTAIEVKPCPRLWVEAASKMYTIMDQEGSAEDRDLIKDLLISTVGYEVAGTFLSWMDTQDKPVTFEEIVKDPEVALNRYNTFYTDMRNDLIGSTSENIVKGINQIHEKLIDKISYKTSILEYDRNSDEKLATKAIKEFNSNINNNMGVYKKKLDNLITFLKQVPNDVMFQVSHAIITNKPFLDNDGKDSEVYHKETIKRFDAYNTIVFYLYRDDLIEGGLGKGLYDRFIDCTKEVEKYKKKDDTEVSKKANG